MAVISSIFEQCNRRLGDPGSAVHGRFVELCAAAPVQPEGLPVLKQLELLRFKCDVPMGGREQARRHRRENQKKGKSHKHGAPN
jgi:hypothetical protein